MTEMNLVKWLIVGMLVTKCMWTLICIKFCWHASCEGVKNSVEIFSLFLSLRWENIKYSHKISSKYWVKVNKMNFWVIRYFLYREFAVRMKIMDEMLSEWVLREQLASCNSNCFNPKDPYGTVQIFRPPSPSATPPKIFLLYGSVTQRQTPLHPKNWKLFLNNPSAI